MADVMAGANAGWDISVKLIAKVLDTRAWKMVIWPVTSAVKWMNKWSLKFAGCGCRTKNFPTDHYQAIQLACKC